MPGKEKCSPSLVSRAPSPLFIPYGSRPEFIRFGKKFIVVIDLVDNNFFAHAFETRLKWFLTVADQVGNIRGI